MAVPLKILVVFIMSITFSVINSPPIAMVDENIGINLLRKRRETTRGHGCPMGKIFYFTGCRTFKELKDDFITTATKTGTYKTTKVTVQKDKHVKETNVDLSVVALVTPNVKRKPSANLPVTQQIPVVTETNINVKPLKSVVKSKLTQTDPRLIMKSSNKESRNIMWTEPASVLVVKNTATTTATPTQLQQKPHVLESNPNLSVAPKSTFMKTKTTSVSQPNIVKDPEVQKLKNMSELSNVTEMVSFKNAESNSIKSKQKTTATTTEATPVPTGTRLTDADSDSSTTNIISRRIPGSHLLDMFFSEFETLTGICVLVLLGISVLFFIRYICRRKYKNTEKCQNETETAERKTKQIDTSNQES